ncbi:MAG: sulfatase, partial [Phycisphaerae bacterium]
IAPHPPWNVPVSLAKMYEPASLPLPARCMQERERLNEFAGLKQDSMELADASDDKLRLIKALYYTSVSMIDQAVGRILASLEELGLAEQTVVIFVSDHGEMLGDHWAWGKKLFYDGSVRVPLILRWPGRVPAGRVCDELVNLNDILPTCLDAAGLEYCGSVELAGQSLLRLLEGSCAGRDVLFGECDHGQSLMFMARTKRYKYIYTVRGGVEELFDLDEDPQEFGNVAGEADYGQIRRELRGRLLGWLRRWRFEPGLDGQELRVTPADEPLPRKVNRQDAVWPQNLPAEEAATVQSAQESLRSVSERTYRVLGCHPRDP